jgi:uncharacterized membrane protein
VALAEEIRANLRALPGYMAVNKVQAAFFIAVAAFALATVLAPLAIPHGTVDLGCCGVVGGDENAGEIAEIENPAVRLLYQAGDVNCHQMDNRSFFLNGNQMPFCARCTAIFVGMPLGMLAFYILRRPLNPLVLILSLVPLGIDGLVQALTSYESSNLVRVLTGSIAGVATGYALAFLIAEVRAIVSSRPRRQS